MRAAFKLMCALTLTLLWTVMPALADVPTEMSVQGRLTNGAGAPVPAGLKNFTFKIFDQQVGGVEIWPGGPGELQTLTTDANGLWNAGVGEIIPLTETVFQNPVRWLQVTVDDGVNPIETLPRIELRTNPYTYRAATSEQADSLSGNSYSDLVGQFVDEAGDVMTGPLANNYIQKNTGTSISIDNPNDGLGSIWGDGAGTWGLSADVSGDNNFWNIGVAGAAHGTNNQFEPNRGVFGYADGTGSINIGVEGITGGTGTGNYSGYFAYGDFAVTTPQTPGTLGVQFPPDAIDQYEILDEPGIAFGALPTSFMALSNSATAQDLATATISIPTAGYVVVQGSATLLLGGTLGTNFAWIQIDTTGGGGQAFPNNGFIYLGAFAHAGTSNEYQTGTATKVYYLGAGTYTFRVEGNGWISNAVAASNSLYTSQILATFYPRSYGGVSSTVASAGGFEHADQVSSHDPQSGTTSSTYQVDLRELELRAARTQAEAERAKRELLEAKTSALHLSNPASTTVKVGGNQ